MQDEVKVSRPIYLSNIISNVVWIVGIWFLLSGVVISSTCKYIAENYMIKSDKKGGATGGTGAAYISKPQLELSGSRIEPMYAFDVHCNSFFPVLVISFLLQVGVISFIPLVDLIASLVV